MQNTMTMTFRGTVYLSVVAWSSLLVGDARAGFEWWHHLTDMSAGVWSCMDSCSHTDDLGPMYDTSSLSASDVLLDEGERIVGYKCPDESGGCCLAAGDVSLGGSVTATRTASVSFTHAESVARSYGVDAGVQCL
jgi:hypothetical protein